eukprot:SAG22_NODE_2796_length_2203_cov_7.370247_1_plen_106_part_10
MTASGLRCHPEYEGRYVLQDAPVNGRPHWMTADGRHHLYWTPVSGSSGGPAWVLDSDTLSSTDTSNGKALAWLSPADAPPTGAAAWVERCDGDWATSRLRLAPSAP